jgi:hypothetical protein
MMQAEIETRRFDAPDDVLDMNERGRISQTDRWLLRELLRESSASGTAQDWSRRSAAVRACCDAVQVAHRPRPMMTKAGNRCERKK